ncbi:MAG: hypothetical protein FWF02_06225 [Micrococcales bacterium]|nr:hypothetical protein [Micrococcales bacterium]
MPLAPRYALSWNEITGRPDPSWLTVDAAREVYEAPVGPALVVVDGSAPLAKQAVRAAWRIRFTPDGLVRVSWMDEHGSVLRQSYFETVEGRLFRTRITDRSYPNNDQRWLMYEAQTRRTLDFHPDGAIFIEVHRNGGLDVERGITTGEESAWYLDRPAFGEWVALLNPGYGLPADDPSLDPRLVQAWGSAPVGDVPTPRGPQATPRQ